MSSLRDIKQRISNVTSVEQIVGAMDMVASTKLHKARAQLEGVRPIYYELKRKKDELKMNVEASSHPFFRYTKVDKSLYIVLTSDKGLSGSYNANVFSTALDHMNQGKNERIISVGSRGSEFFKKNCKNVIHSVVDVADAKVYYSSERVAKWLIDVYLSGEVQEVFIVYTYFKNVLRYQPIVEKILPLGTKYNVTACSNDNQTDVRYEPNVETFIDNLIPLYLHMSLFLAYCESHTSEQAARMVNMDAAKKNASDLTDQLNHMYNRQRQTEITQELAEIVGSANILNKGGIYDS